MCVIKLNSCGICVIPDRGPEEMYTTGVCLLQALGALEGQGDVNNKHEFLKMTCLLMISAKKIFFRLVLISNDSQFLPAKS